MGYFSGSLVHLCLEHVEGDVLVNVLLGDPLDQIFKALFGDGVLIAPEGIGFDLHKIGDVDKSGFQFPGGDGLYFFLKGLETGFMVYDSCSIQRFKRLRIFFNNQFIILLFILFLEICFNGFKISVGLFDDKHGCKGELILDI